jgi:Mrp family chromosome partitioning ATPase
MSRVYSMLTGAECPAAVVSPPDDGVWENAVDTPFVEIGGPGGPVFSPALSPPVAEIKSQPNTDPKPEPARVFPRLAPPPAGPPYLSVRFHDLAARTARPTPGGPDPGLVVLHAPDHPVSGEYRAVRDEIRNQLPDATSRVLLFSAAAPEAGTTTVLLNLALALAQEGRNRVLVLDANVTRPGVAPKLALKPGPGLCEVLAQQVPLAWAVQPSPAAGLQVLAAGGPTDATPKAVCRDGARLVGQLRQWYDWVLVDAGVWGAMPERDGLCPAADAVYLVTREADAALPAFAGLRGWVKEVGGLLRGYVATRV